MLRIRAQSLRPLRALCRRAATNLRLATDLQLGVGTDLRLGAARVFRRHRWGVRWFR